MRTLSLLLLLAVTATGCYHARVETGLTPGATVIDQPWALSFVYGLIPPPTVETAAQCPQGVALVETELSFLNQLVSGLTAGLITPMHIKVTCAAGGTGSLPATSEEVSVAEDASTEDVVTAFQSAADLAATSGEPIVVRFK